MKIERYAGMLVAFYALPAVSAGQQSVVVGEAETDEIVVIGRSVTTSAVQVEVEREMIVDAAAVLRDIPGANVNSNGPITGIAQYRGMYGDRVAVDIDGMGVIGGGPNAMDAPLSYTSPMITRDLIVERGVVSVSSAPETVGGYVQANLSRGDFAGDTFGLSGLVGSRFATAGNINTSAGRLTLADRKHRFSVVGEIDRGDDLATPRGDIRPTRLDRRRYDVSYALNTERLGLLAFAGKLDTEETGTPSLPMDIRFIDTDLFGVQVDFDVAETLSVEAKLAYNDVRHLMDNFGLRQTENPMRHRENLTNGSGYQYSLVGNLSLDASNLRVGFDGIGAEHDSTITNPNSAMFRIDNFVDIERDVNGAFAEWSFERGDSNLQLGLRYNRVDADAGRVGAVGLMGPMSAPAQQLADAFNAANRQLKWTGADVVLKYSRRFANDTEWLLEVGSKSRAPSYQELYLWLPLQATGGLADGRTYVGNLGLESERSNEIVLGFAAAGNRFAVSPQLFFKRIDDYIQGTPSDNDAATMLATMMSGNPALAWSNVDAEIWGADIAWKYELSDRWYLDGTATAVRGRRTDVADNLYRLAPFNGSIGLTRQTADWSIKTELVAYARQEKVSSFNNEQATPGYELVNVSMAWNPFSALRVEVRVDNLFDTTYQDHLTGVNRAAGSDIAVGERLYGIERSLSAGLIYTF